MRRRDFVAALCSAAVAWPLGAQQPVMDMDLLLAPLENFRAAQPKTLIFSPGLIDKPGAASAGTAGTTI
jgi:hypothetical protein